MTETGRMAREVTAALLLQGSSQITWGQITPQATQAQVLAMALLTSSPDHNMVLVTTLVDSFGVAWAQEESQEEFLDTSLEIGVKQPLITQPLVILGEQTTPTTLPGPHHQAPEHALPQDLVVPKGDEMLRTMNLMEQTLQYDFFVWEAF